MAQLLVADDGGVSSGELSAGFLGALLGAGKTWFTATRLANAENERDGYGQ